MLNLIEREIQIIKRIIALTLFLGSISCVKPPPEPPANIPDPKFCGLEGDALLQALEGSWKLYQEPGVLLAGPIVQPLFRQSSTGMTIKKIPGMALMDVNAADHSDGMRMFVAVQEQEEVAKVALEKNLLLGGPLWKEENKKEGFGCPERSLPVLIGTRDYSGRETFRASATPFCKDKHKQNILVQAITRSFEAIGMPTCNYSSERNKETGLDMKMTLVVRFPNPRYGVGTVIFTGKRDDTATIHADNKYLREDVDVSIPVYAQAPIVIAR